MAHNLEKVASLQTSLSRDHHRIEDWVGRREQLLSGVISHSSLVISLGSFPHHESVEHIGGLVTPPSPRSQSSDSGRYRRSSGTKARGRSGSGERAGSESGGLDDVHDDDADTGAILASSTEGDIDAKACALAIATAVGSDSTSTDDVRSIPTVVPHELERVDKEDDDQIPKEDHQQIDELESVWPLDDNLSDCPVSHEAVHSTHGKEAALFQGSTLVLAHVVWPRLILLHHYGAPVYCRSAHQNPSSCCTP